MATLERTAYPRFPEVLAPRDMQACYTPLPDELEWARRSTRGERPRLGLLVLLKVFQQLHYFPPLDTIPAAIVDHVRAAAPPSFVDFNDVDSPNSRSKYGRRSSGSMAIHFPDGHVDHVAGQCSKGRRGDFNRASCPYLEFIELGAAQSRRLCMRAVGNANVIQSGG